MSAYARQELLPGWEQLRLSDARVAILGDDMLAGLVALNCACLGVGNIVLLGNQEGGGQIPLWTKPKPVGRVAVTRRHADTWVGYLAISLGFASTVNLFGRYLPEFASEHDLVSYMPPATVLVTTHEDTTEIAKYADHASLPLIRGRAEHPWQAPVIAGLIVEEVRRLLLPETTGAGHICEEIIYRSHLPPTADCRTRLPLGRIMMIGAGALGNFAALAMQAHGGFEELRIIDPDYVEETNLNRQPFFLNDVGESKAFALYNKLIRLTDAPVNGFVKKVEEQDFDDFVPTLVLSCVDNLAARRLIHEECRKRGIPLVNGGTSAFSGHAEIYRPGETACFDCLYGLDEVAKKEELEALDPARCAAEPEPSIAMTNAIVAGLMIEEAVATEPYRGMIRYDAEHPDRILYGTKRKPCLCA